jgi:hypothetical protein
MNWRASGLVLVLVALLPWVARADKWDVLENEPILIRARSRPNSAVREIWAEADLDAPAKELEEAILDAEAYPRFMPYVKETRYLKPRDKKGGRLVYSKLEFPLVSPRDSVVEVFVDSAVETDGSGHFANHWFAQPDIVPPRESVVRIRITEGSWQVFPKQGKAHVVYRVAVDPGQGLPPFLADMGHRAGVTDTFRALEREARHRAESRRVSRNP